MNRLIFALMLLTLSAGCSGKKTADKQHSQADSREYAQAWPAEKGRADQGDGGAEKEHGAHVSGGGVFG